MPTVTQAKSLTRFRKLLTYGIHGKQALISSLILLIYLFQHSFFLSGAITVDIMVCNFFFRILHICLMFLTCINKSDDGGLRKERLAQ